MKTNFSKNKKALPAGRKACPQCFRDSAGRRGFSLVEMIVAIFIFSLVMTTVTSIFVQVFNTRKKAKEIQLNIEDTRAAMELMAKSLRMSNVRSDESDTSSIIVFDYSQNKCIRYFKDNDNKLKMISGGDDATCDASYGDISTAQTMMNGDLSNFSLDVEKSNDGADTNPKKIGKVTIAMTICADTACRTEETIQTTVSLRDYGYIMPN